VYLNGTFSKKILRTLNEILNPLDSFWLSRAAVQVAVWTSAVEGLPTLAAG
jgi:hypothetical protein